uniref:Neuromedin U C-terminal domain-containing protein n=1 Tax=Jaculus jaculus TaxID=51337 RepID=A0A8C5KYY3_JACJA
APRLPQGLWPNQELQLWNEIYDDCSSFLPTKSQPQVAAAAAALRELCLAVVRALPKRQEQYEKDNTKRFLFHYSKTQKPGNSNAVSPVAHPLPQLLPRLRGRRVRRIKEEFQRPFASRSRGYFLFRPRNGRRSAGFI